MFFFGDHGNLHRFGSRPLEFVVFPISRVFENGFREVGEKYFDLSSLKVELLNEDVLDREGGTKEGALMF